MTYGYFQILVNMVGDDGLGRVHIPADQCVVDLAVTFRIFGRGGLASDEEANADGLASYRFDHVREPVAVGAPVNGTMKTAIGQCHLDAVERLMRLFRGGEVLLKRCDFRIGCTLDGQADREDFQLLPDREYVPHVTLGEPGCLPGTRRRSLDKALRLQLEQGFAQRCPADVQAAGDRALGKPCTRRDHSLHNAALELECGSGAS